MLTSYRRDRTSSSPMPATTFYNAEGRNRSGKWRVIYTTKKTYRKAPSTAATYRSGISLPTAGALSVLPLLPRDQPSGRKQWPPTCSWAFSVCTVPWIERDVKSLAPTDLCCSPSYSNTHLWLVRGSHQNKYTKKHSPP